MYSYKQQNVFSISGGGFLQISTHCTGKFVAWLRICMQIILHIPSIKVGVAHESTGTWATTTLKYVSYTVLP